MKVKFSMYEIPLPGDSGEIKTLPQARVQTKGTIKMDTICDELRHLGVNSSQIKAVLDAVGKLMKKSLLSGYNFELEDIGIFSLSLRSKPLGNENGNKVSVGVDGVNFRCNKKLKEGLMQAEIELTDISRSVSYSTDKRKKKLFDFLQVNGIISISKYARLMGCNRYRAAKELKLFEEEKLLVLKGDGTHRVYQMNNGGFDTEVSACISD